ncbi:cytosolic arginine sensor for mTORC1 subunit 1 isoform X7 [Felis catus]|uniref:cytosolic arginine sensor for mTORC1 subunit 1 isoform X7 n=1 Tax=Felis catus TaxID=9685 RepID=UPI0009486C04|nr:cytosolic arginine sensor for mTORC1 subunit 1 isoform X7 [Felis catus]
MLNSEWCQMDAVPSWRLWGAFSRCLPSGQRDRSRGPKVRRLRGCRRGCKFFSLTETPEDYTLMVDEEGFKELPPSEFLQVAEATWLVLNVSSHSGAAVQAAGVTKIARSVIAPLAEHHVSVLMLSTYQTDFILVREQDLSVVIHTLSQEFNIYREVGGEPVPVARDDSSNGFPRSQHAGPSPTVHPIQSPQNRFCVLTLDPETLPAIATTLIDVLFYSYSSAALCPVLCLGFLAACDTRVPLTDVQGRSRCHSCNPFLYCEQTTPSHALVWSSASPGVQCLWNRRDLLPSPTST